MVTVIQLLYMWKNIGSPRVLLVLAVQPLLGHCNLVPSVSHLTAPWSERGSVR